MKERREDEMVWNELMGSYFYTGVLGKRVGGD